LIIGIYECEDGSKQLLIGMTTADVGRLLTGKICMPHLQSFITDYRPTSFRIVHAATDQEIVERCGLAKGAGATDQDSNRILRAIRDDEI
jgi:hypothetical protein